MPVRELSEGKVAIVDDEDDEWLSQWRRRPTRLVAHRRRLTVPQAGTRIDSQVDLRSGSGLSSTAFLPYL